MSTSQVHARTLSSRCFWSSGFLCLCGTVVAAKPCAGQWDSLGVGTRIRAISPAAGGRVVGTVVRIGPDTLWLRSSLGGRDYVLGRAQLSSLDRSEGRHSHIGIGILVGAATGVALGVGVAVLGCQEGCDPTVGELAAIAGIGMGAAGALTGLLVGALTSHEIWRSVSVQAGPDPQLGRLRVGIRLRF